MLQSIENGPVGRSFSVQKFPAIFVGGREAGESSGTEKHAWQQIQALRGKATLAQTIAVETCWP
jgi:hypothetical protein